MKRYIVLLLSIIALFLCACNQTEKPGATGSTPGGVGDINADVIDAKVSLVVENAAIDILLTNGTIANVSKSFVDQDFTAEALLEMGIEEPVSLTWNYQYDGIFLKTGEMYTLLLSECKVSLELECTNKEAVTTALLASLAAAGLDEGVYACYEDMLSGETCNGANLEGYISQTWILELNGGKVTALEMFNSEIALLASVEFYDDNSVKRHIQFDVASGAYDVREYNENGDPTKIVAYSADGIAEKTFDYVYFKSGALKGFKRYTRTVLGYECVYDEAGKIIFEFDYDAERESHSDTYYEGDFFEGDLFEGGGLEDDSSQEIPVD